MTSIRDAILKQCSVELQLVPFSEWYASLESVAANHSYSRDDESLPGIKLLEFFSRLSDVSFSLGEASAQSDAAEYSTDEIQAVSDVMRTAHRVTAEAWVKYWRSSGFL
ncbi:hypothetical protein FB451DRAFT_85287 [Mycena latifolia]|nr:hypothetical protein FB451DRAFT_85287 [Mycena latifolia]